MSYFLYIIFGVLPSFVWLIFYLAKDKHPEPRRMILKIFLYGMLAALPAVLLELGVFQEFGDLKFSGTLLKVLNVFIGVALVEELLKYWVVRRKVLRHPELDEPFDVMLYMIISALGFAASENILILVSLGPHFLLGETVSLTIFRFIGATFLHTLCSGLLGYFLALSFCYLKYYWKFLLSGVAIATLLHGLYNFSIMEMKGELSFLIPLLILTALVIFFTYAIRRLQKLKSVCKI